MKIIPHPNLLMSSIRHPAADTMSSMETAKWGTNATLPTGITRFATSLMYI